MTVWIRRVAVSALTCGLALAAPGCGNGLRLYPVQGQVYYKGEPADGAMLAFHPKGESPLGLKRPSARTSSDGSFRVSTFQSDDGAPDGEYGVTVIWLKPAAGAAKSLDPERAAANSTDIFKGKYADPAKPRLSARVEKGATTLPRFDLD